MTSSNLPTPVKAQVLASGEWRESVLYFLFDISLVGLVSAAVALGVAYWRSRHHKRVGRDSGSFLQKVT